MSTIQSSIEDFDILEKLGSGTFGNVYKARRKVDSQIYALKRVDLTGLEPAAIDSAVSEAHILAQIHSNLIISYYDSFFTYSPRYELVIVTEYVNGGTLSDILSTYSCTDLPPEPLVWSILIQLLSAVYDLHCVRILHRYMIQTRIRTSWESSDTRVALASIGRTSHITEILSQEMSS